MKQIISLLVLSLLTVGSYAQGIHFETGDWDSVVEKAQKEKKLIFLDVYASWCGPCKMMDKKVFPDKAVGDYYNQNFISYKVDGEKGEGKTLAQIYGVTAYPTNFYINPTDKKVISKEMGYVAPAQFIQRGESALADFNDPRTWEDFKKEFKKKSNDKAFLEAYIRKGNKLEKDINPALDSYVDNFKPAIPTNDFIQFLSENIKSLNNKGVDYIVDLYSGSAQQLAMLDEWLPTLYDQTFFNAVSTKDVKKLDKILWASQKTNNPQAQNIYNRFVSSFYKKNNDTKNYWKALEKEVAGYQSYSTTEYKTQDSLAYNELIKDYKNQLNKYGVPEDQHMSYIEQQLKDKLDEAQHQVSYMNAAFINEALYEIVASETKDRMLVQKAENWADFMLELAEPFTYRWAQFGSTAAEIYALNNNKNKAKATIEKGIQKNEGNTEIQNMLKEDLQKYE